MRKEASIQCSQLSIGYDKRVVQASLSFALYTGEMVCLLGRNGCGKSTLLRTLAGLQRPLVGELHIGQPAIVLTERLNLDNTTVREVVAMGRYPYTPLTGRLSEHDWAVVDAMMDRVGLTKLASHYFNALSDGEKQRVLIAKAMSQETDVILLDEPTAHLDIPNRICVMELLRQLAHEEGKTILISTHELELALRMADRILLMSEEGVRLETANVLIEEEAFEKAFGENFELRIMN